MPPQHTTLQLKELLLNPDPIIYRSALSILQQLNKLSIQKAHKSQVMQINNLANPAQVQ